MLRFCRVASPKEQRDCGQSSKRSSIHRIVMEYRQNESWSSWIRDNISYMPFLLDALAIAIRVAKLFPLSSFVDVLLVTFPGPQLWCYLWSAGKS